VSSLLRVIFDPDTTAPGTPSILSVLPVGQSRLDITWSVVVDTGGSGLAGYDLLKDGATVIPLGIQTSYSDTGLASASSHTYRVRARDAAGNLSAYSTQASGTTDAAPAVYNPDYPRRASYAIGGTQNASNAALAERCVNILAYGATWAQRKGVTLEAKASAVKALSTIGTKMVPYVIHVDVYDGFAAPGNDFYEWYSILTTNQWFVYNNGLTHDTKVVGSSSGYSKPNYTTSCPVVAGDTAFTWKAKWDYRLLYTGGVFNTGTTSVTVQGTSSLDGKFDDNIFIRERSAGDYTVDGVSESVSSAANISLIQSSHAANLAYWRTLAPSDSLALCNFADWPAYGQTSMSGTALDQIYDGGVHENITEYFDGPRGTTAASLFNAIKLCYDACKGPKLVILRLQLASATDYARLRLWDCVAALTGSALYEHVNAGYLAEELGSVNWDEKNFKLGQPSTGTAGAVQWTPQASGAYRRDFLNGIVLLNGSASPITVSLGGTFYRLLGSLDPTTNNGQSVTSVTLAAKSGLFLARVSQDTIAPSAPSSLAASAVSSSQINLSWNASTDTGGSGLATYRVERSPNGTSGWLEIGTSTTTSYSDTGLASSTQFFYRVRARDAVGNDSAYSNIANATTQAGGATLTALLTALFDTGTLGAACSEYNYAGKTNTAVYSSDVAGPFGEGRVGKIVCTAGSNFYGGWLAGTQSVPTPAGGDLWIRAYFYFPSSFCASYGTTSGDGFGLTKFIRIDWSTTQRMTLLVGDYSGTSCASASVSPRIALVARELQNNTNADMDNFVITRDAWHAIQLHVKFTTGTTGGIIEVWVDNHHCGRITNLSSLPTGFTTADGLLVPGDYWNGSPRQNTAFYVSNIIVATSLPSTAQFLDSGQRPYIPPALDARTL